MYFIRSISTICTFSKIVEHSICNVVAYHCVSKKIIPSNPDMNSITHKAPLPTYDVITSDGRYFNMEDIVAVEKSPV